MNTPIKIAWDNFKKFNAHRFEQTNQPEETMNEQAIKIDAQGHIKPLKSSQNENFIRLATQRTNKVLKYLRMVLYLSNKANYEYSEEEVHKILDAIEEGVAKLRASFEKKEINEFKF